MNKKDFLYLCVSNGISMLAKRDEKLESYKELTDSFAYPCSFNKQGVCFVERTNMCCCADCASTIGYLNGIRNPRYTLESYASNYDEITGFWRVNKGCILPRSLRSIKCVTYICTEATFRFKCMNNKPIVLFTDLLSEYKYLSKSNRKFLHKTYNKLYKRLQPEKPYLTRLKEAFSTIP